MKKIVVSFFCLLSYFAQSQTSFNRCAFDEVNAFHAERNPEYKNMVNAAFNNAKQYAQQNFNKRDNGDILRIPVVVHIVYNTAQENIDDSLVLNQIEVLNEDFRRKNTDTASLRNEFLGLATDAGIEFYLACEDPDGNPTNGITRTVTTKTSFGNFLGTGVDEVKFDSTSGKSGWNSNEYLNIWVCNTGGAVLGLAYPPQGAPNWPANAFSTDPRVQGVVVHYEVFGKNNPRAIGQLSIADRGRTAVHEVGHYLGLRHIWGDGTLSILGIADCTVDDGIDDTPNSGTNSQIDGCSPTKNTCNDGPGDLPDLWENYMDYSEERCQTMFTQGQIDIMRAMVLTARSGLLQAKCADTTSTNVTTKNIKNNFLVNVYPNPSNGNINVSFANTGNNTSISITNTIGIVVYENVFSGNESTYTINTETLSSGIYFLHVESGNKKAVKRIIIQQ
mgnify:CR=1 FL=1